MTSGIYWIYQISRDRAIYVGSSVNVESRLKNHRWGIRTYRHKNKHLQNTFAKYGDDDFQWALLEETSVSLLIEREQFWIDAISPSCNIGVSADNARRGRKCSSPGDETRRKMSLAHKGRALGPATDEHRLNNRNAHLGQPAWNKGIPMRDASRKKLSDAHLGKRLSSEHKQSISNTTRGKPHSAEHTRNASNAQRGRTCSAEVLENMRKAHIGFRHTEETKALLSRLGKGRPWSAKRRAAENKRKGYG